MPQDRQQNTVHHHPLVAAYLDDLDRALSGADDGERRDVLASVREHIDEAMAGGRGQDVGRVLDDLGPVEHIAREASDHHQPALHDEIHPSPSSALWLAVAAGLALGLLIFIPFIAVPLAIVVGVLAIIGIRERRQPAVLYKAAAGLSATTLVFALVAGLTLAPVSSRTSTVEDAVPAPSPR